MYHYIGREVLNVANKRIALPENGIILRVLGLPENPDHPVRNNGIVLTGLHPGATTTNNNKTSKRKFVALIKVFLPPSELTRPRNYASV